MKFGDMKDLIELSVIIIAGLFSVFGIQTTSIAVQQFIILVFGIVALTYGSFKAYRYFRDTHREVRSMSNINVIKKSRLHCNSLYKFAQVSRKKLEKNKDMNYIKQTRQEEDKILDIIKGKNDSKDIQKLQKRIENLRNNYSDRNTITLIKSSDNNHDYSISKLISDTFCNLERVLLNAEQYNLRIKFGKYILDFSDSELNRQRASIDFLGWTYLMMGEIKKGEKAIELGIKRAEYTIATSIDKNTIKESNYYIARAYRHLGSARYTYENYPDKAIEYLKKGETQFNKLNRNDYPLDKQVKLDEMIVGIQYGLAIAYFYKFKNKLTKQNQTDEDYKLYEKAYYDLNDLVTISASFANKHRFVKVQILRSKYLELYLDNKTYFEPHVSEIFNNDSKQVLFEITSTLNSVDSVFINNVFTDEAVELYLEESVKVLKYKLINQLQGEFI